MMEDAVIAHLCSEIIECDMVATTLLPPAETLSKDEIQLIHENNLSASSSCVIETQLTKKNSKKTKATNERPKSTHEKLKKLADSKPDVKYAHKLGEVPKYLKKIKEASRCSSLARIEDIRPKTVNSLMINIQKPASKDKISKESTKEVQSDGRTERNKSLELKIARLQKEVKLNAEAVEKLLISEIEITNLKKSVESLNGRLRIKDEAINRFKNDIEKLSNELKMQSVSNENLCVEKKNLQNLINDMKKRQNDEVKENSSLVAELVALNEKLQHKCKENSTLKEINLKLVEENDSLNLKLINSSSRTSINTELIHLQEKNKTLKKSEEILTHEVHKLQSLLDDEKNTNISNETLLSLRSDYITTLQETDDINKMRLASQAQELLNYKKQAKEFEKFKAAFAEEKKNFEGMLNGLQEKIIKLKAEKSHFQNQLDKKSYKYQHGLIERKH